jgi:5,10-methylenetetrahydromethanopterin reductase
VLGIGRGDSVLFQIGLEPAPLAAFERFLGQVAGYLRGDEVDLGGFASRVGWIANLPLAPVPVDVAATGPKVIELSARIADRITFAVGANPERVRWGSEGTRRAARGVSGTCAGAYVNVAPHPDVAVARSSCAAASARWRTSPACAGPADGVAPRIARCSSIHALRARATLGRARHAAARTRSSWMVRRDRADTDVRRSPAQLGSRRVEADRDRRVVRRGPRRRPRREILERRSCPS